jgi:hypothetical protein
MVDASREDIAPDKTLVEDSDPLVVKGQGDKSADGAASNEVWALLHHISTLLDRSFSFFSPGNITAYRAGAAVHSLLRIPGLLPSNCIICF